MTAALEGVQWSAARPGRTLPPGKTRYPLHRRLGGPQGRSGRAENLVPTGIRSRTVQPVVSRYTDLTTLPKKILHIVQQNILKNKGAHSRAWGGGLQHSSWAPFLSKFKRHAHTHTQILQTRWYHMFFATYPSAEISQWNRLITTTDSLDEI